MSFSTNGTHPIRVGSSLMSTTHDSHYAFRYSPRAPLPTTSNTLPFIQSSETNLNALQVSFPSSGGTSISFTATEASDQSKIEVDKEVDCVLLWDPLTKGYKLERVDSILKFQQDSIPRAPPPPKTVLSLPIASTSNSKIHQNGTNGNAGNLKNGFHETVPIATTVIGAESSDEEIRVSSVPPKHLRKQSKGRAYLDAKSETNPSPVGSPLATPVLLSGIGEEKDSDEDEEMFEEVVVEKEDMGDISSRSNGFHPAPTTVLPVPSTSTLPARLPESSPPIKPAIEIITKNNKRKSSASPAVKTAKDSISKPIGKVAGKAPKLPTTKVVEPKVAASKRPAPPKPSKAAASKSPSKAPALPTIAVPKKRPRKDSLVIPTSLPPVIIPSVSKKAPAPTQSHTAHPPPSSGEETDDSSNNDDSDDQSEPETNGLPEGYLSVPSTAPGFGRRNSGENSESEEGGSDFDDLASSINFGMGTAPINHGHGMGSGGKGMGSGGKGMGSGGKGMGARRKSSVSNGNSSKATSGRTEGKRAREEDLPDSSEED